MREGAIIIIAIAPFPSFLFDNDIVSLFMKTIIQVVIILNNVRLQGHKRKAEKFKIVHV